jgi:delta11-fatty-acid desaturase
MITLVNGEYYDLTNFNHPGGDIALNHAIGRDSTVLFESHHPFVSKTKLNTILEKYRLTEEEVKNKNIFIKNETSDLKFDTEFSRELISKVKKYFEEIALTNGTTIIKATKATFSKWIIMISLFMVNIMSYYYWLSGYWFFCLFYPISSWLSSSNISHDACHFSISRNPFINEIMSYTGYDFTLQPAWYSQHNLGHHMYTNHFDKDPDLHHGRFIARYHKQTSYKNRYKIQFITNFLFLWTMSLVGTAIYPIYSKLKKGYYFKNVKDINFGKKEYFNIFLFILNYSLKFLPLIFFDSLSKGLLFTISFFLVTSMCFMINTQLTHLHHECMEQSDDWYKSQVLSSSNFGTNGTTYEKFIGILSGGLNYQIEHHLFPNVNHCHHFKLKEIVQEVCENHNVSYKKFDGYYDAFIKYCRYIIDLSSKNKNLKKAH